MDTDYSRPACDVRLDSSSESGILTSLHAQLFMIVGEPFLFGLTLKIIDMYVEPGVGHMEGWMTKTGPNDLSGVVWALGMSFSFILAYFFYANKSFIVNICSKLQDTRCGEKRKVG